MQTHILECPKCGNPFEFDCDDGFPAEISCPHCHESSPAAEYSALIFCPGCHQQLSMSLDMVGASQLVCPGCGRVFDDFSVNDAENTTELPTADDHLLHKDEFFDKYRIESFIGAGGMAEVYLARHLIIDRLCALKVMKPGIYSGNPDYVKRFIREARICFKLESPFIVKVYDSGRDSGTGLLFIAMEYVEGKNLAQLAIEHTFSEAELREIGLFMAQALQELQKHGIVHRDIKPANIIKDNDGQLRLMDMGIAKNASGGENCIDATMTMDNMLIGTPAYASPEQCRSAHDADIRSDIYSLGATLYHLASGQAPYSGATAMEVAMNVLEGNSQPLKKVRKDLSTGFTTTVEMMMAKEPSKRPQNPQALEQLLKTSGRRVSGKTIGAIAAALLIIAAILILKPAFLFGNGNDDTAATDGSLQKCPGLMVSGLPRAKKPARPFRIDDYTKYLHSTNAVDKAQLLSKEEWKNRADCEMIYAILAGDVWNVFALLELGFDINAQYEEAKINSATPAVSDTLGGILFHGAERTNIKNYAKTYKGICFPRFLPIQDLDNVCAWKDTFIRMFLFLAENGLDLNKNDASGNTVMNNLMALCDKCDDKDLQTLLPIAMAYGGKVDQKHLDNLERQELKAFLQDAMAVSQPLPAVQVENRLTDEELAKDTQAYSQLFPNGANSIRAVNASLVNSYFVCYNTSPYPSYNQLKRFFSFGLNPNALLLRPRAHGIFISGKDQCVRCSETLIRHEHDTADPFYLVPHPQTPDVTLLDLLMASGWRAGMEEFFEKSQDPAAILLLWKHGANVTVSQLNACKDEKLYELLLSLYKKQWHCFGSKGILHRDRKFWDYFLAEKALLTPDAAEGFSALAQLIPSAVDANDTMKESPYKSLLELSLMRGHAKCTEFLLKSGAEVSAEDRIRNYAAWNLLEYTAGVLSGLRDNQEKTTMLWATGKFPRYDGNRAHKCTFLCEVFKNLQEKPLQNSDFTRGWEFLMANAGLTIHQPCPIFANTQGGFERETFMGAILSRDTYRYDIPANRDVLDWMLTHGIKPSPKDLDKALARMQNSKSAYAKAGLAYWQDHRDALKKTTADKTHAPKKPGAQY